MDHLTTLYQSLYQYRQDINPFTIISVLGVLICVGGFVAVYLTRNRS